MCMILLSKESPLVGSIQRLNNGTTETLMIPLGEVCGQRLASFPNCLDNYVGSDSVY
jgi:hypothetical protein